MFMLKSDSHPNSIISPNNAILTTAACCLGFVFIEVYRTNRFISNFKSKQVTQLYLRLRQENRMRIIEFYATSLKCWGVVTRRSECETHNSHFKQVAYIIFSSTRHNKEKLNKFCEINVSKI